MASDDRFHNSDTRFRTTAPVPELAYRCVCGEMLAVHLTDGATCSKCGRKFTADAILADGDGTKTHILSESLALMSLNRIGSTSRDGSTGTEAGSSPSSKPEAPVLPPGTELEHFRIVSRIARGGMGVVYHAVDESLQRDVALKVLTPRNLTSNDTSGLDSLLQEARAQARVNHNNVVHIYYIGRNPAQPFLAMELVSGETIADRLKKGPLPFQEVVQIALQVTDALDHASQFDIVHADIKPSNMLQCAPGKVKLSDFGLARLASLRDSDGGIFGTPNYLSPEIARGEAIDFRSDMYSLGVTLFEMTFGRLPYEIAGSSVSERLRAHRESPIVFPEKWPADVPQQWRGQLNRMMAKSADDRFSSYAELSASLKRFSPRESITAATMTRGMAYVIDLMVAGLFVLVFFLAGFSWTLLSRVKMFVEIPEFVIGLLSAAGTLLTFGAPLLILLFQMSFGKTPGKMLLQLRIVDDHGLSIEPRRLAIRSIAQFLPLWSLAFMAVMDDLGLDWLEGAIGVLTAIAVLADVGFAIFSLHGRSLHDRLFGTRVILDASGGSRDLTARGGISSAAPTLQRRPNGKDGNQFGSISAGQSGTAGRLAESGQSRAAN